MGKIAKWKNFSENEIREIFRTSYSNREVLRKLGYNPDAGSITTTINNIISKYNIDTSHFTGQSWNKNNFNYDRFQKGKVIKNGRAIDAIVALRGHKCECCGNTEWLDKPITLEVHHKDGDNLNNELDNLQLLCPNCHSQTENWRGKNIDKQKIEPIPEDKFVEALENSPNIRQALIQLGLSAKGANYKRAYDLINKYQITHLL